MEFTHHQAKFLAHELMMKHSHEDTKARRWEREEMATVVVDCGFRLHRELGPGLLESVYLTYLRLLKLPLGLLLNFGSATFKDGTRRILNGPQDLTTSPLRINQSPRLT